MSSAITIKPQLHISGINLLAECGEAYRRRYVDGDIIPPGVALVTGTAVDRAVTENLANKIDEGELLPVEAVRDAARDGLVTAWAGGVALDEEERQLGERIVKGDAIDKAVRLAELHAVATAPTLEPVRVQRPWTLEVRGSAFDLAGTIDVQEARTVRDTKTSGKSPAATAADDSEQLTLYALAVKAIDGEAPERVVLDYLVDLKSGPKAVTLESTRARPDFERILRRLERAEAVIAAGAFMPAKPDAWRCSPRFCGYWSTCPFARRPVTVAAA